MAVTWELAQPLFLQSGQTYYLTAASGGYSAPYSHVHFVPPGSTPLYADPNKEIGLPCDTGGYRWQLNTSAPYLSAEFGNGGGGGSPAADAVASLHYQGTTRVRVLPVRYDPILHSRGGIRLSELGGDSWAPDGVTNLSKNLGQRMSQITRGYTVIDVLPTVVLDKFPPRRTGNHLGGGGDVTWTETQFLAAWEAGTLGQTNYFFQYNDFLDDPDVGPSITARIQNGEIEEVWLWGEKTSNWGEGALAGPSPQIYPNGPQIWREDWPYNAVIMGFNWQAPSRAPHAWLHRAEYSLWRWFPERPDGLMAHFSRLFVLTNPVPGSVGDSSPCLQCH